MIEINNIHGVTFSSVCNNINDIYKRTGNKNVYEEVIDNLIMLKYSSDLDLIEYIKTLPLVQKRIAILSLMDNDHYSWDKLREKINGNRVSKVEHLKDLIKMFRDFIKIAEVERKRHGEIMTPMDELARPMVDLVEKYDENFWKNPDHKVLDSSAGIGTFLIICAAKFMNGLKDWQPDPELRFKHIIENCLYYGELQSRNAFLWLCAIDPYDEYKTNTYWGSFLDDGFNQHMKNVWNVDKFDLIIQNPPYQEQKETDKNKTSKNPKTQPLWHIFVQKSLSLLDRDKYMVMVHPGGWRNSDGVFKETQNILKNKEMLFLKMHSFKDGLDLFGAKINFDYYIVRNSDNMGLLTRIICEDNTIENIDISKVEFVPGENISEIFSMLATDDDEKIQMLHSYSAYEPRKNFMSKEKSDDNIFPCVYMVSHKNVPTFLWSTRNDRGHFGQSKVIWASGSSGIILDNKGEYALTPFSCAIIDDQENLENIKRALESDKFIKKIMLFKNGLGHKYNNKIISMLKKDFWKSFM